jgi:hypothetical protein
MTRELTMKNPNRVGEPVQVYLNDRDRDLLDELAERSALARSEVMRVALRRLAADLPGATKVGAALPTLVGALDSARDVPADLAARHDEYLYAVREGPSRPRKPRKR